MKRFALLLLLLPMVVISQDWYWANGNKIQQLARGGSVQDVMRVYGGKLSYMIPDWDSLILYAPIAGKVVAVKATDSSTAKRRAESFNREDYIKSENFKDDFLYLRENMAGRTDILKFIGNPKMITKDTKRDNVEYFHYDMFIIEVREKGKLHAITRPNIDKPSLYPVKIKSLDEIAFGSYVVGFSIQYENTSQKDIKYILTTVKAYNSVHDFIGTKVGKGVGPVEPGEMGYFEFDNLFYSKVIAYYDVSVVKIIFVDGTQKIFQGKQIDKLY